MMRAGSTTALSTGEPLKSRGQGGRGQEAGLCPEALSEPSWGPRPPAAWAALTRRTHPAELPLAALPGQRVGSAPPQGAPVQYRVGPAQALLPGGLLRALHQGRREGALLPDRVQHPAALQPADAAPAGGGRQAHMACGRRPALPCTGPFLLELGGRSAPRCPSPAPANPGPATRQATAGTGTQRPPTPCRCRVDVGSPPEPQP